MITRRQLIGVCAASILAACVTISEEPPALIPEGWNHDYDYKTSLKRYLRDQYNSATVEGATAYIYIYSDLDRHCLGTRRMLSRPDVTPVFHDVRVTMLNFERLKRLYDEHPDSAFDPGEWVPVIVKISLEGDLSSAVFYPDMALYHKPKLNKPRRELWGQPDSATAAELVDDLRRFFESSNEI